MSTVYVRGKIEREMVYRSGSASLQQEPNDLMVAHLCRLVQWRNAVLVRRVNEGATRK